MNPLFNMPPEANQNTGDGRIKELARACKGLANPNTLINANPTLRGVLAAFNGDARAAFYSLCKSKGIDPDSILKELK